MPIQRARSFSNDATPHFEEIRNTFSIHRIIGQGTYGIVASARRVNDNQSFAIKKIVPNFWDAYESLQILREVKLLKLCRHQNVLCLEDFFVGKSGSLYLITDLMTCSLKELIRAKRPNKWEIDEVREIIYQLNSGVAYLHDRGIIHRDMKPENVLINSEGCLKICDFGLARYIGQSNDINMTHNVVTQNYRAPEIILSTQPYNQKIDMWAVGVIIAEMFIQGILFDGTTIQDQIFEFFEVLGKPSLRATPYLASRRIRNFITSCQVSSFPLSRVLEAAHPEVVDLVSKLLVYNPAERLSAQQVLEHHFLNEYGPFRHHSKSLEAIQEFQNFDYFQQQFGFEFNDKLSENPKAIWNLIIRESSNQVKKIPTQVKKNNGENTSIDTLFQKISTTLFNKKNESPTGVESVF